MGCFVLMIGLVVFLFVCVIVTNSLEDLRLENEGLTCRLDEHQICLEAFKKRVLDLEASDRDNSTSLDQIRSDQALIQGRIILGENRFSDTIKELIDIQREAVTFVDNDFSDLSERFQNLVNSTLKALVCDAVAGHEFVCIGAYMGKTEPRFFLECKCGLGYAVSFSDLTAKEEAVVDVYVDSFASKKIVKKSKKTKKKVKKSKKTK